MIEFIFDKNKVTMCKCGQEAQVIEAGEPKCWKCYRPEVEELYEKYKDKKGYKVRN